MKCTKKWTAETLYLYLVVCATSMCNEWCIRTMHTKIGCLTHVFRNWIENFKILFIASKKNWMRCENWKVEGNFIILYSVSRIFDKSYVEGVV